MRNVRKSRAIALLIGGLFLAPVKAQACVLLPVFGDANTDKSRRDPVTYKDRQNAELRKARRSAREAMRSDTLDPATWIASALVPEVRPLKALTDSCGEVQSYRATEAFLPQIDRELPSDVLPLSLVPPREERESGYQADYFSSCNREFRAKIAADLTRGFGKAHLAEFYVALEPHTHVDRRPLSLVEESAGRLSLYRDGFSSRSRRAIDAVIEGETGAPIWEMVQRHWPNRPRIDVANAELCPVAFKRLEDLLRTLTARLRRDPSWPGLEARWSAYRNEQSGG